jgi:hypothetical protein
MLIWAEMEELKASCQVGHNTYTLGQPVTEGEIQRILLTVAYALMNSGVFWAHVPSTESEFHL